MNCSPASIDTIAELNQNCNCISMRPVIDDLAIQNPTLPHDIQQQLAQRTSLFAETAVFISRIEKSLIQAQINAIEAIGILPEYIQHIRHRDNIANYPQANTRGILMGYDFHLTPDGPKLIEVNTNAGGAFIMQHLLSGITEKVTPCDSETLDNPTAIAQRLLEMVANEYQLSGRDSLPASVAIIDHDPQSQYLLPDMRLAQQLFENHGIQVSIASPADLKIQNNTLLCKGLPVDFVYNRTTDFALQEPASSTLKTALEKDLAVITPNPLHHAVYADKRNPEIWTNPTLTKAWGVNQAHIDALSQLPVTETVSNHAADDFWARRKNLFFKPTNGFASRAVYRGNKITRKVWSNISNGHYIAQSMIPPATRKVETSDSQSQMKFDVRVYTYRGQWLLGAARIYQGQTTNFRTPGGGFAPLVYMVN